MSEPILTVHGERAETAAWEMPMEPSGFWKGADIATLAQAQGVLPVRRLDDLWGDFWPEEESVDDFIAAVRRWRWEGTEQ